MRPPAARDEGRRGPVPGILNRPVYELLGGPHRDRIRVYANGWYTNPGDPALNAEEARAVAERGFDAMKFDPFGRIAYVTSSAHETQLAEDRVARVREAVGPNVDILVEGHARFNVQTAVHIGKRLEPYRPYWFEEPVSQENISEMAQVRRKVDIPSPPASASSSSSPSTSSSSTRPWTSSSRTSATPVGSPS